MNTLNLFLKNAGGEHVEAVHKRILWWLFHSPTIIQEIFGDKIQTPKVALEAHGKLFDLQIKDGEEEAILIELKMWSSLKNNQRERQIKKAKELKAKLCFILFSISYLEMNDYLTEQGYLVIGADELSKKLLLLAEKSQAISEELKCPSEELKSFLTEYSNRLSEVNEWFINEAYKPDWGKHETSSHFASLFNKVKESLPDEYSGYIYRTGQGDAVKLELKSASVGNRKINIGGIEGTLLFWLSNNVLQIFFHHETESKDKEVAIQVRNTFLELLNEKENQKKRNSLPSPKGFPNYLSLISVPCKERNPSDLISEIEFWYPLYERAFQQIK